MQSEAFDPNAPWQTSFLRSLPQMNETPILGVQRPSQAAASYRASGYTRPRATSLAQGETMSMGKAPLVAAAAAGYARASPVLLEEEEEIYIEKKPFPRSKKMSMGKAPSACERMPSKHASFKMPFEIEQYVEEQYVEEQEGEEEEEDEMPAIKIGGLEIKEVIVFSEDEEDFEHEYEHEQKKMMMSSRAPCKKPKSMCDGSMGMCEKPKSMCEKPKSMCEKPKSMCEKPKSMCEKPKSMCEKPPKKKFDIIKTIELPEVANFDIVCDSDKRLGLIECHHAKYAADVCLQPQSDCVDFNHYFNAEAVGQYFYDVRDVALLIVNTSKASLCDDTCVTNYFYICPVKIGEGCHHACVTAMQAAHAGKHTTAQPTSSHASSGTKKVVPAKTVDVKLKIKHFCGPKVMRDGIYPVFCSTPECDKFICASRAALVIYANYLVECFGHMYAELACAKMTIEGMAKEVCKKDFSPLSCDKLSGFLECLNHNVKKWKLVLKHLDIEESVDSIKGYLMEEESCCEVACPVKKC